MKEARKIPVISVGIKSSAEISFTLNSPFRESGTTKIHEGIWTALIEDENIVIRSDNAALICKTGVIFTPLSQGASFTLHSVTIGVDFHWQRSEDQVFKGDLKLIIDDGKLTAINIISLEEYLKSVISSEMSSSSAEELLKAHAVISRGWLLAQAEKRNSGKGKKQAYPSEVRTENELVKWYDREDHRNFDVCADDHCQRYQGITRTISGPVDSIIEDTSGQVLTYKGALCDTRYYKCCGGITEHFENVWEPVNHPYLRKVIDNDHASLEFKTDLTIEAEAVKWIKNDPYAFCNTKDEKVLSQVLNDYDMETPDFYRWKIRYSQNELSDLVRAKTGIDFGTVSELRPLERGVSGRIIRLEISGSKKNMVIGKELEIRKALSKSHLYSSCFYVDRSTENGIVWFTLYGAGWGHGVGLCQIGAAVMAVRGYTYRQILEHYFPGSVLEKRY